MDLFDPAEIAQAASANAPLAERMRPRQLDEILGQDHLLAPGKPLRTAIESGQLSSMVFWGPPGVGKTTLARLLAQQAAFRFVTLSAVSSGVKDLKEHIETARVLLSNKGKRTLLFIDEIHRYNKSQQDLLLPQVESGIITLIGATTENPSFELNAALLSRCRVLTLNSIDAESTLKLLRSALSDGERGLAALKPLADDDALHVVASLSGGDGRRALNLLEALVKATPLNEKGERVLTAQAAQDLAQKRVLLYDKDGEQHYDIISALHKSVRSSDPDAACYWATRMLEAGEDPLYLCRRLTRMASEDIGNADPGALRVCLSAKDAYDFLGSPEGEVAIIQAAIYVACAPKSDASYQAYNLARAEIDATGHLPVPMNLRNAPTKMMKNMGYGQGYQHAHQVEDGVVDQQTLPEGIKTKEFYHPVQRGREKQVIEYLDWLKAQKAAKAKKKPE